MVSWFLNIPASLIQVCFRTEYQLAALVKLPTLIGNLCQETKYEICFLLAYLRRYLKMLMYNGWMPDYTMSPP